jgi:hypothetical protein
MTAAPGLARMLYRMPTPRQMCSGLLHRLAAKGVRVSGPAHLTLAEVVERCRCQISEGTLRNWRSMRIGPSFLKIGKAVLYPLDELDRWDRRNL